MEKRGLFTLITQHSSILVRHVYSNFVPLFTVDINHSGTLKNNYWVIGKRFIL